MNRQRLVGYLDEYLKIGEIPDKSLNGLQVEGAGRINRVAFAVDACRQTIRSAARRGADILIVHHGLFWSRNERITGVMRDRIAVLIENKMSSKLDVRAILEVADVIIQSGYLKSNTQ